MAIQTGSQWLQSSSGSRAQASAIFSEDTLPWPTGWDDGAYHTTEQQELSTEFFNTGATALTELGYDVDDFTTYSTSDAFAGGELPPGAVMSTKIPPSFDGKGSWFALRGSVMD